MYKLKSTLFYNKYLVKKISLNETYKMISEFLVSETGIEKKYFENQSIENVENRIGIPRYNISDNLFGRRGFMPFEKGNNQYLFDVKLLSK